MALLLTFTFTLPGVGLDAAAETSICHIANFVVLLLYLRKHILFTHSNDSHQCPILTADFGIENEEAIQAGVGSE